MSISNHQDSVVSGHRCGGFSLVEVMVALIVIAIGVLGIAKIQALAYSSSGTSSARSLAAIEAASLAANMRANRAYWSVNQPSMAAPITVLGTVVTTADATLTAGLAADCTFGGASAPCTPVNLAGYDLQKWATDISKVLPADSATISCATVGLGAPMNCSIGIQWTDKVVAVNSNGASTAGATSLSGQQTYTLYVEP